MSWVTVAIVGGSALLGANKADQQRKADIANNKMQAEISKYAPWTGQWGKIGSVGGGWFDGALQGGLSGLSMAQKVKESGLFEKKKADTLELKEAPNEPKGWATMEASKHMEMPEIGSELNDPDRYRTSYSRFGRY